MKFHSVPVEQAIGHLLAHNVFTKEGKRFLRKGRPLTDDDAVQLHKHGYQTVYVAEFETGDVEENEAAQRIGKAVAGSSFSASRASTGRVNFRANHSGVLTYDSERLLALNLVDGVALGTQSKESVVQAKETIATLKIFPYALPAATVERAEEIAANPPLLQLKPFRTTTATLILWSALPSLHELEESYQRAMSHRLERVGGHLDRVHSIPRENANEVESVAKAIRNHMALDANLLLMAGDTAIMDENDVLPQSVHAAGGEVTCFGSPADPGSLFMLAYLGDRPIIGLPSCARGPKLNVVDLILPRIALGERLTRRDIALLGDGGLLNASGTRIW